MSDETPDFVPDLYPQRVRMVGAPIPWGYSLVPPDPRWSAFAERCRVWARQQQEPT
jgi:hypothetical protein